MNKEEFLDYCKKISIDISVDLYELLNKYYELLVEWNNKFNMTTITKKEDVFLLHFYDSLLLSKYVDLNKKIELCDFGTGAGFPGLVLAIVFNNINVTLIESNGKKCSFLEEVVNTLKLKNVKIINDRMEIYSKNNKEKFDIVTCRAVTLLPIILELSIASLKVGGLIVPLKANCEEEILLSNKILKDLNLKLNKINNYTLPINNAKRTIVEYEKIGHTNPIFPRNYNVILKKYKDK